MMDKSSEYRTRTLAKARIPAEVALCDTAPLLQHRRALFDFYGLGEIKYFKAHLSRIEASGRAKALAGVDVLDRVALSDPEPGNIRITVIEPRNQYPREGGLVRMDGRPGDTLHSQEGTE